MASKFKNIELDLETILNTPASVKIFRLHVQRDLTEENLDFYLRVKEFKKGFNSIEDNNAVAQDIIENFILAGSPQQLNLGDHDMKKVVNTFESVEGRVSASIFDEVQLIILSIMESNSYTRFVNGPLYRLYLGIIENDAETDLSSFKSAIN